MKGRLLCAPNGAKALSMCRATMQVLVLISSRLNAITPLHRYLEYPNDLLRK
jgi:hypothetical protein